MAPSGGDTDTMLGPTGSSTAVSSEAGSSPPLDDVGSAVSSIGRSSGVPSSIAGVGLSSDGASVESPAGWLDAPSKSAAWSSIAPIDMSAGASSSGRGPSKLSNKGSFSALQATRPRAKTTG